ncbi:MAG: hypothetical protein AAFX09_12080 [Pseudomonadota bacterium]
MALAAAAIPPMSAPSERTIGPLAPPPIARPPAARLALADDLSIPSQSPVHAWQADIEAAFSVSAHPFKAGAKTSLRIAGAVVFAFLAGLASASLLLS